MTHIFSSGLKPPASHRWLESLAPPEGKSEKKTSAMMCVHCLVDDGNL